MGLFDLRRHAAMDQRRDMGEPVRSRVHEEAVDNDSSLPTGTWHKASVEFFPEGDEFVSELHVYMDEQGLTQFAAESRRCIVAVLVGSSWYTGILTLSPNGTPRYQSYSS